jgi:hypothetical protein
MLTRDEGKLPEWLKPIERNHEEGQMKSKLALSLAFVTMVAISAVGFAGSPDQTSILSEDDDQFIMVSSATGNEEPAAANPARVARTGQTRSYQRGDDGALRKGVAWPKPRFKNNGDGTVTDKLTGLIWLKNAQCSEFWDGDATGHNFRDWNSALSAAAKLKDGACGLTDGSREGSWRIPNRKELESLLDAAFKDPCIPNTAGTKRWTEGNPFSGVQRDYHWSSTTCAYSSMFAWCVHLNDGSVNGVTKTNIGSVWPVRGGQ